MLFSVILSQSIFSPISRLVVDLSCLEYLVSQLLGIEDPLALLDHSLDPLSVFKSRVDSIHVFKPLVISDHLEHLILGQLLKIIIVIDCFKCSCLNTKLVNILRHQHAHLVKGWLKVFVIGRDLGMSVHTSILQDVVEAVSLVDRLTCAMDKSKHQQNVMVNLVCLLAISLECSTGEHLC